MHMLRRLFPWAVLSVSAGILFAQENLVRNGGFEEKPQASGVPASGWWLYDAGGHPEVATDTKVAHRGTASLRLHGDTTGKFTLVSPRVPVAPGDEIKFEIWVRADGEHGGDNPVQAGLAFRAADGRVFDRHYFHPATVSGEWSLLTGTATSLPEAVEVELHLSATNTSATIWYDDASAVITSRVSLQLLEGAKPWPGDQEIQLRVTNRKAEPFRGTIAAVVGKKENRIPVALEPNSSRAIKVPITLGGVGTHNYRLSLQDEQGQSQRTLVGKFRADPALVLLPACPCYHAIGEGTGSTRVDARINASPGQRAGATLLIELADASGKKLSSQTVSAASGAIAGANVMVPVNAAGDFTATARLRSSTGKELGSASTDIHVRPAEQSRVTTGISGFLRVAGKPEFPIGMYSCGQYEEMAAAGFNGTHNYGITAGDATEAINPQDAHLKELLDRSAKVGMRMMVELPRKAIEKAAWGQVKRRIETFRHHPGLLCWGSEERVARGEAPLKNIAEVYRLVHELDPNHPLVLGDTKDVIHKLMTDRSDFFPDASMDAGIWWWYPIPLRGSDTDGNGLEGGEKATGLLQPPAWLTTTISKKPLWIAIQSYQQPRRDARFPTPTEYRCMAYLSIINGVKGLWFYTGSGQKDWQGKPAGLLNKPEEGHWDYVQKLVRELKEISPIIMAPPPADKLTVTPAASPVQFSTRELDGRLYILAANQSTRPQTVTFSGAALAGKRAEVRYETHPVSIQGESLEDNFSPLESRLYVIEK